MQGLWLENQRITVREDIATPIPAPGEALIQVSYTGICGTDLQLAQGYYPFTGVIGHEFVGRVIAANHHPEWLGTRVVGEINVACGQCSFCTKNQPNHCAQRKVLGIRALHGAFAQYITLPIKNLHRVPDQISDQQAVFAEPVAAALQILNQVTINADHKVLVIGAGKLGQIIAQVLHTTGCELHVAARYPVQQQLLANQSISTIAEQDIVTQSMDFVIEASGSSSGFALACNSVLPQGTIVLKSTFKPNEYDRIDLSPLVVNEIQLIGSRCGPFPTALSYLEKHKIDPTNLIDKIYPLCQGVQAFEYAKSKGAMKILINTSDYA